MHHADPGLERLKRRGEPNGLPIHADRPLVAARIRNDGHSKKDVHERGLSRAVLPHQTQDLARHQGEIDVREHPVPIIFLPYPLQPQQGSIGQCHHL